MNRKVIKTFTVKCEEWANQYVSAYIIGAEENDVLEAVKEIEESNFVVNGTFYEGKIAYFEVFKTDPYTLSEYLTKQIPDAMIYVIEDWDGHILCCKKGGRDSEEFYAAWDDEEPREYFEEGYDEPFYDCDVIITDKETGFRIPFGGGMCNQTACDYIASIVEYHRDPNIVTWLYGACSSGSDGVHLEMLEGNREQVSEYIISDVLADKANFTEDWDCGTEDVSELEVSEDGKEINAYGNYSDWHINYTAKVITEEEIKKLYGGSRWKAMITG